MMVLGRGCKIAEKYIDDCGNTCAIGALAKAAGIDRETLKSDNQTFISSLSVLQEAIMAKFGFNEEHLNRIQSINDANADETERTDAVLTYVGNLKTTD